MATKDFSKEFENGGILEYDRGKFDDYCVYKILGNSKEALNDIDYFNELSGLSEEYGEEKIYSDFVKVYDNTHKDIEEETIILIEEISHEYKKPVDAAILYTTLYMTMIAEENKAFTKLGKRIKRLGVYTLLIEKKPLKYSTNFMRGKRWREIDKLCKERGF